MSAFPVGELAGAALGMVLGSLVAGAEASLVALPEARLRALHDESGPRRQTQIGRFLQNPTRVLTRLLTLRVTALIVACVLATNGACRGRAQSPWLLAGIVATLTLTYGMLAEVFTTLGRARARSIAPRVLVFTLPLEWLIAPVAAPLAWLGTAIQRRASQRTSSDPPPVTEREVEYLVEEAEHSGALDPKRGQMMQNVLELKELTARDVMVPRTKMHAVEAATSVARAFALLAEEGHSRLPVYRGQIDNVVGMLHAKDLFRAMAGTPRASATSSVPPSLTAAGERATPSLPPPAVVVVGGSTERPPPPSALSSSPPALTATGERSTPSLPPPGSVGAGGIDALVRKPAFFVSEGQSALEVLREMQSRRTHMAVVVDEFGAVAGLVTLEDILEELVGDIQDEHDVDEVSVVDSGDGRYLVSAAIPIGELGEHLGVEFPEAESYASLGGFLAERAGKVPAVGTVVQWNGFTFTVKEGDARRATKVEIVRHGSRASRPPVAHAAE